MVQLYWCSINQSDEVRRQMPHAVAPGTVRVSIDIAAHVPNVKHREVVVHLRELTPKRIEVGPLSA